MTPKDRYKRVAMTIVVSALISSVISSVPVLYALHGHWKTQHAIELRIAQQEGRNLAAHLAFCMQVSEWAEKYQNLTDTNVPEVAESCRKVETKVYNHPVSFLTKRGEL